MAVIFQDSSFIMVISVQYQLATYCTRHYISILMSQGYIYILSFIYPATEPGVLLALILVLSSLSGHEVTGMSLTRVFRGISILAGFGA